MSYRNISIIKVGTKSGFRHDKAFEGVWTFLRKICYDVTYKRRFEIDDHSSHLNLNYIVTWSYLQKLRLNVRKLQTFWRPNTLSLDVVFKILHLLCFVHNYPIVRWLICTYLKVIDPFYDGLLRQLEYLNCTS